MLIYGSLLSVYVLYVLQCYVVIKRNLLYFYSRTSHFQEIDNVYLQIFSQ